MQSESGTTMKGIKTLFACLIGGIFLLSPVISSAQSGLRPMSELTLDSMDDFGPVAGNWQIVGDVAADRFQDHQISTSPGAGILVNIPSDAERENIFTDWEHGDIELEMEFMMPKGSNAGVYLQGRYEIQMFDSWGVENPTYSDVGGIYQRFNPQVSGFGRGYEGHAPSMNVARAPGLWQRFEIRFQAPRFDEAGKKIANAKMIKVVHNGVVIHENVELTGPTTSAAFSDEQAMGPLMIQGDHGPVAIRNIRYKRYKPELISLSNTHFQEVAGEFTSAPDFSGVEEKAADGIDWRLSEELDKMALRYSGEMRIPYAGTYTFQLRLDWVTGDPHYQAKVVGGGTLTIGDQVVLDHSAKSAINSGEVQLEAGTYPYSLVVFKNKGGQRTLPRMAVWAEGSQTPVHSLNAPGSLPQPRWARSIFVEPAAEPSLIRGFINHDGVKKTHTMAVGHQNGVHYTMDFRQGALMHVWKGKFIEATDMWHSRGQEQLAVPLGSVIEFSGQPTVAHLGSGDAAWPDSAGADFAFRGYELNANGYPTFGYTMGDLSISDRVLPEHGGRELYREVSLRGESDHEGYWIRIAEGDSIQKLDNGDYSIDGNMYYVSVLEGAKEEAVVRSVSGGQELVVPFSFSDGSATVRYTLIW